MLKWMQFSRSMLGRSGMAEGKGMSILPRADSFS